MGTGEIVSSAKNVHLFHCCHCSVLCIRSMIIQPSYKPSEIFKSANNNNNDCDDDDNNYCDNNYGNDGDGDDNDDDDDDDENNNNTV